MDAQVRECALCYDAVLMCRVQGVLLDEFLANALANDAVPLLRMERDLEGFLADAAATRYRFPVASSYQRLMAHRMCQHFGLRHTVVSVGGAPGGKAVCAFKTADTRMPPLRLVDLVVPPAPPQSVAVAPADSSPASGRVLVLRRQPESSADEQRGQDVAGTDSPTQTSMAEREAKYLEAKVRIFGRDAVEAHAAEERAEQQLYLQQQQQQVQQQAPQAPVVRAPLREHKVVDLFADPASLPQRPPLSVTSIPEFIPGRGLVTVIATPPYTTGLPPPLVAPASRVAPPATGDAEFARPPPRSNGRLFDPNAPSYAMAPRGRGVGASAQRSPPQQGHVRFAVGASVDVVRAVCEPLGALSVHLEGDCVIVVFGSPAQAASAAAHVDCLVPPPFRLIASRAQ